MKVINVCPQPVYSFEIEPALGKQVAEDLVGLEWVRNGIPDGHKGRGNNFMTKDNFLHLLPPFKNISDWFIECVNQVGSEYNYTCERFSITMMWGNKSPVGGWHHTHSHPFSVMSGIYYVNDSEAHTWFSLFDHFSTTVDPLSLCPQTRDIIHKQPSEKGKLVVFPSHLMHSVDEHKGEDECRYTISFNTFPSGAVGRMNSLAGAVVEIK
jgi:uncharacterized protein (TIGR02466 family)